MFCFRLHIGRSACFVMACTVMGNAVAAYSRRAVGIHHTTYGRVRPMYVAQLEFRDREQDAGGHETKPKVRPGQSLPPEWAKARARILEAALAGGRTWTQIQQFRAESPVQ